MRIHVDMERCESHGQCVFAAPGVFAFDEEDNLLHAESADDARHAEVAAAAAACPARAITILTGGTAP